MRIFIKFLIGEDAFIDNVGMSLQHFRKLLSSVWCAVKGTAYMTWKGAQKDETSRIIGPCVYLSSVLLNLKCPDRDEIISYFV
jgi:hypothetical protein